MRISGRPGAAAHLAFAVLLIALLLFLRRPDSLTNPQFYAEDGRIFFHDQILSSTWSSLWSPYAGYLHFIPRLTAAFASQFSLLLAPLMYNGTAILLAALSCAVFYLPAFRPVLDSDPMRLVVCCLMAVALDSGELVGTITNIQWYLQIAAILLLLASLQDERPSIASQVALAILLLLLALSVPMLVLLIPFALWGLVRKSKLPSIGLLIGIAIQLVVYVLAGSSRGRGQSSLFNFHGLITSSIVYLACRPVLSSFAGRAQAMIWCSRDTIQRALIADLPALALLALLWFKAEKRRIAIAVCLYFAVASTVLSVGAGIGLRSFTFGGERYFYLAACCVVLLVAIGISEFLPKNQDFAKSIALLAIFAGGISGNFRIPPYGNFNWPAYEERIATWHQALSDGFPVQAMNIPINPVGWDFTLEGTMLTGGDFEGAMPREWSSYGNVSSYLTRRHSYHGTESLEMKGVSGGAAQGVAGLTTGKIYHVTAMVFGSCPANTRAIMSVEDGKGIELSRIVDSSPLPCDSWHKLDIGFAAPKTARLMIRLIYRGNGSSLDWDDVQLHPDAFGL